MADRRAALLGIGFLLIGLGGYVVLPEPWGGLCLVAAGIALVLLGLSLDRPTLRVLTQSSDGDRQEDVAVVPEPGQEEATEPAMPSVRESDAPLGSAIDHRHDDPVVGHSELVEHLRDQHRGVPNDGSTLQLRLLHEREHVGGPPTPPPLGRPHRST